VDRIGIGSWIAVEGEGDRLRLRTSQSFVARRLLHFRLACAARACVGLALVVYTPWALVLTALGLAGLPLAPRFFKTSDLVDVDRAADRISPLQTLVGVGRAVPASHVRSVRGVYEVYGWDPRSTVYVELEDGERNAVLVFVGTDEELARDACQALGKVLDVEATYAGPYGAPKVCFAPAAQGS